MNERIKYRYWQNKDWHDPNSELEPIYCNIVDGCDPTIAVSYFEFCTGLKDKNGNLIYEGDVLKAKDLLEWVVIYKNGMFCGKCDNRIEPVYDLLNYGLYLIGNIHENPELLENNNDR